MEFSKEIFIPTLFSPNGDDVNDVFFIQGSPDLEKIDLIEVFDRWGNEVYERHDILPGDKSSGWDGLFKGSPVSPGVYVYVVNARFSSGAPLHLTGDVTILR